MRLLTRLSQQLSLSQILIGLFLIGSLGLLACGPTAKSLPQLPGTLEPATSQPTPTLTIPAPLPGEESAPIERVAIEVSGTDPRDADLVVVSGLPNSCYTFGHYSLSREGDTFQVEIVNQSPTDPMMICAMVYGMVTTRIPLEGGPKGGIETCQVYLVVVNQKQYKVQAIAPNVRCGDVSGDGSNEVDLRLGERTRFSWTDLELTFVEVTEDSRCPSDVVCVWAGRATAVVETVMYGEESNRVSLTLGDSSEVGMVPVGNYTLELIALDPYPVSTKEIPVKEYVARVAIGLNPKSEGVRELRPAR